MNNIDNIFLFLFIFSIISFTRVAFGFISALVQNPPKKFVMSTRELIFYGLALSYVITFLLKN